jgi:hypothetical protein
MKHLLRGAVLLLGVLVAGCASETASGQWQHPTRPSDQWSADLAACRSEATKLVERELDRGGQSYVERNQTQLQEQLSRFSANKRRNELTDSCMRRQGYTRGSGEKDADRN